MSLRRLAHLCVLCFLISITIHKVCCFKQLPLRTGNVHARIRARYAIDVSGLKIVPIADQELLSALQSSSSTTSNPFGGDMFDLSLPIGDRISDLQNAAILLGGIAYFVYEKRPRGSARTDLLEIRRSKVPNANLGVFAKSFIAANTVIGYYPGYLKKKEGILDSKTSDAAKEQAKKYMWDVSDDTMLDPTNAAGSLDMEISYLFGLVKVNTLIARINEPPPRGDCNLRTKLTSQGIEVTTERDIFAGEELFMDYGQSYNRAEYGEKEVLEEKARAELKKKREEEDMLTLQPIISTGKGDVVDQDTSLPKEGFIGKLSKQDEKLGQSGILRPDEAANMFAEMGAGMFSSDEDKELIESLLGKDKKDGGNRNSKAMNKSQSGKGKKSSRKGGKGLLGEDDAASMFGGVGTSRVKGSPSDISDDDNDDDDDDDSDFDDDDEDILKDLVKQMGSENMKNFDDIPNLSEGGLFGGSSPGSSSKKASMGTTSSTSKSKAKGFAPPATPTATIASADSMKAKKPDRIETKDSLLSKEEAWDLQRRLDEMTDEQVEQVFAKIRTAVGDKLRDRIASKLDKGNSLTKIDPALRKKYGSDADKMEEELGKILNPVDVWKELVENSDKYFTEGDNNKTEN